MRLRMRWLLLAMWLATGCVALSNDMRRAETAFEDARYEDVEVWLSALEKDVAQMDVALRARFYYLRGTTAYRLQKPEPARHYLALAREESRQDPTLLKPQWRRELERMLEELQREALDASAPGAQRQQ